MLERALHLGVGAELGATDLHFDDASPAPTAHPAPAATLAAVERRALELALVRHGNVATAAKQLGISRSALYVKVKALGLLPKRVSAVRGRHDGRRAS